MMNKRYVADSKKERIKDADKWLNLLKTKPEYVKAINEAKVDYYTEYVIPTESKYEKTKEAVYNNDVAICTKAAITHATDEDRICVLDFASYSNPGGGFLKGSLAQEESICRMSGLYPLLVKQQEIYDKRNSDKDRTPLYGNDMFYCSDVPFMIHGKGKVYKADIIVAAAPNAKAAQKYFNENDIKATLKERMRIIYLLPSKYGCSTLLLGAFGCGVFGNDLEYVASIWHEFATVEYPGLYKQVTHPVFDAKQSKIFKDICRE